MTYLARHDGRQPVRLTSQIGRRLPATSTATGKAALASLDPRELDRRLAGVTTLPARRRKAHRTVDALLADLDAVRARGYAIDDEETMEGVVCYGIAIPGRHPGEGPYAASITLLKVRATDERVPLLSTDLHRLSDELSDPLRRLDSRPAAPGLIRVRPRRAGRPRSRSRRRPGPLGRVRPAVQRLGGRRRWTRS